MKRAPVKQNDMEHIGKCISFLLMFGKRTKRIVPTREVSKWQNRAKITKVKLLTLINWVIS